MFLGLCTSHVSRPGWIKKTWYSSSPSSSTRKSGIYLIISQTVFWAQIFRKWMVMGHFAHVYSAWNLNLDQTKINLGPHHKILPLKTKNSRMGWVLWRVSFVFFSVGLFWGLCFGGLCFGFCLDGLVLFIYIYIYIYIKER